MTNEITDCPFCGSANIAIGYIGQPGQSFFMRCVDCEACGPASRSNMPTGGSVPPDVLTKWNLRALAAPSAASDAPDGAVINYGTLPPLPNPDGEIAKVRYWNISAMKDYARAAISASQAAPKEALTLDKINELAAKHIEEHFGLVRNPDPMGEDHEFVKMCRAIEAATAPNPQLVAALQRIESNEIEVFDEDLGENVLAPMDTEEMIEVARSALAGVAPLPQAKEGA